MTESQPTFHRPRLDTFRDWFKYSRVKRVVYHATSSDFDSFDTSKGDLGAHFGTLDQANHVAQNRLGNVSAVMPVWLNLCNPLRLKDVGSFHADGIARQLEAKGLLPRGEGKRIEKEIDANWRLRSKYDPIVRQIIKDAGYDGVVYKNTQEGDGDSYIAFEANQIKSAIGNSGCFCRNSASLTDRYDPSPEARIERAISAKAAIARDLKAPTFGVRP